MHQLDTYSDLWLNVWRYALSPTPRPEVVGTPYYVLQQHSGGYMPLLIDPTYQQEVIKKMIDSGVRILSMESINEANRLEHMWTDRKNEFVLVRWKEEPEFLRVYSLKFQEFADFPIFSKEFDWDYVKRKMKEGGVRVIDKKDLEDLNKGK